MAYKPNPNSLAGRIRAQNDAAKLKTTTPSNTGGTSSVTTPKLPTTTISNPNQIKSSTTSWLPTNPSFGKAASDQGMDYITKRDADIAKWLSGIYDNQWQLDQAIGAKLKELGIAWAQGIQEWDIQRTVERIRNQTTLKGATPTTPTTETTATPSTSEAWYYTGADGKQVKILWYDDLDADTKSLVDNMSDEDKKMLDMTWGNDVNGKLEYLRQAKRNQEYLQGQRDKTIQINDLNGNVLEIQSSQRLKDAGRNLDNLIQNAGYLGSRGQPWQSATRLQAAQRMIQDATQKYADLKTIETKVAQIRQLWIDMDTSQYEKQMADIADDLNMKVWFQIQNAMNEFTSADLAGQLDTIDGVTQFRRSLLEKLDANISGYTEGSMKQMQYVTQQYDKLAEDAQKRIEERTKNSNTVNTDLSTAKGYYVDWNGNPLYGDGGEMIKMPEKPPLDPIYDHDKWQLITFTKDANWQIVGHVQQVTNEATASQQAITGYAQLLNDGTIKLSDIPESMRNAVVQAAVNGTPSETQWYQWPTIEPVQTQEVNRWLTKYESKFKQWDVWWECGAFVNDYLNSIGIEGNTFVDPIEVRRTQTNSSYPTPWSIAVFDRSSDANASPDAKKYWHVAIVTSVNADGSFNTLESNNKWDHKVFKRSSIPASSAVWFFDPSKWLSASKSAAPQWEYSQERAMWLVWGFGTEGERKEAAKNIVKVANEKGITLQDAKKVLGYQTPDDKEFMKSRNDQYKDTKDITQTKLSQARTTLALLKWWENSAVWDVAAIVWFLKTIDPTSVARESEVASVENARWLASTLDAQLSKLKSGKKLTTDQRNQIVQVMDTIIGAADKKYYDFVNDTADEFKNRWLDVTVYIPKQVVEKASKYGTNAGTWQNTSGWRWL